MNVVLIRNMPVGRRACAVPRDEAECMTAEGRAIRINDRLFQEVEASNPVYETKVMTPELPKARGRPRKEVAQ